MRGAPIPGGTRSGAGADARALAVIRARTRLAPVPLVPEIRLHQAADPITLWEQTERDLGGRPGQTAQPGRAGLPPPYWGFAWPGGQALARYLLDRPAAVARRRVIDLASGSGLAAIAAAMAGAASVTAYDVDPLAVAAIAVNAEANRASITAICADILDTGAGQAAGVLAPGAPADAAGTLVLAADACYEPDMAGRLLRFLAHARACGAGVLVADPGRAYLPRSRFVPVASYDVPGVGALEDCDIKPAAVLVPA